MKTIKQVFAYIKRYPVLWFIIGFGWLVNYSFFFPIEGNIGHDVYWHLALVETAFDKFPFRLPIYAGVNLQGYNYLLDLIMFLISQLGIASIHVYYIIIPLIYLITTSLLLVLLGIKRNRSISYVASLLFFGLLASPFSYLLSFYKRGSIFFGFNYPTATQSPTSLTNLSYAMTIPILLLVILLLDDEKRTFKKTVTLGLLAGLALSLKFYGGVIITFFIVFDRLILFFKNKDFISLTSIIISLAFFLSVSLLIFYDPFSSVKTGGIFAIAPFAIPNNLIEDPDALYMPQLVLQRYTLLAANKFSLRLIAIELITLMIYLVYNFGTRLIGLIYLAKKLLTKTVSRFEISSFLTVVVAIVLTTFFIQKGGDWWNTVQFFGYGLFLFNFFAAGFFSDLFKKRKSRVLILTAVIVLLTLPLNVELVIKAVERLNHPYDVSIEERQALAYLKEKKDDGVVFVLSEMNNMAYVPARSGKLSYFSDEQVISNLGINFAERKKQMTNIDNLSIKDLPVKYFYLLKDKENYRTLTNKIIKEPRMKKIFDNKKVVIYEKI